MDMIYWWVDKQQGEYRETEILSKALSIVKSGRVVFAMKKEIRSLCLEKGLDETPYIQELKSDGSLVNPQIRVQPNRVDIYRKEP